MDDDGFYRQANAYLDGLSGNKEAGIGVRGSITNTFQCNPSNDDNIGPDGGLESKNQSGYLEFVTLTFDVEVQISDMMFRDDNHNEISSGLIGLSLDDPSSGEMLFVVTDISSLTGPDAGINQSHDFFSSTWSFAAISAEFDRSCGSAYEGDDDKEISTFESFEVQTCTNFYIDGLTATPVPVPAAGFLLLGGLGGLVAMKRRRKA